MRSSPGRSSSGWGPKRPDPDPFVTGAIAMATDNQPACHSEFATPGLDGWVPHSLPMSGQPHVNPTLGAVNDRGLG